MGLLFFVPMLIESESFSFLEFLDAGEAGGDFALEDERLNSDPG
jgi:hypothetical protein